MSTTIPTPATLFANKTRPVTAQLVTDVPAKTVRPGLRDEVVNDVHTGVVKTKHLKPGQEVRPYLHGRPRGGVRVVESATRVGDGATWRVEFASAHPAAEFKAAYRWFDPNLAGTLVQTVVQVPAFVPVHEEK